MKGISPKEKKLIYSLILIMRADDYFNSDYARQIRAALFRMMDSEFDHISLYAKDNLSFNLNPSLPAKLKKQLRGAHEKKQIMKLLTIIRANSPEWTNTFYKHYKFLWKTIESEINHHSRRITKHRDQRTSDQCLSPEKKLRCVFAERLNNRMAETCINGISLAAQIKGIGPKRMVNLMMGWGPTPTHKLACRFAELLGCNPKWLLGESDDPQPKKPDEDNLRSWLLDPAQIGKKKPKDRPLYLTINKDHWYPSWFNSVDEIFVSLDDADLQRLCQWAAGRVKRETRLRNVDWPVIMRGSKVINFSDAKNQLRRSNRV